MDLLQETKALARRTEIPVTAICREIGVSTRWYYKFLDGQIKDPSIRRVQRLNKALKDAAA